MAPTTTTTSMSAATDYYIFCYKLSLSANLSLLYLQPTCRQIYTRRESTVPSLTRGPSLLPTTPSHLRSTLTSTAITANPPPLPTTTTCTLPPPRLSTCSTTHQTRHLTISLPIRILPRTTLVNLCPRHTTSMIPTPLHTMTGDPTGQPTSIRLNLVLQLQSTVIQVSDYLYTALYSLSLLLTHSTLTHSTLTHSTLTHSTLTLHSLYTHSLYTHSLYTHSLYTHSLYTHSLYTHSTLTHSLTRCVILVMRNF